VAEVSADGGGGMSAISSYLGTKGEYLRYDQAMEAGWL
jgi:hypothetical protein